MTRILILVALALVVPAEARVAPHAARQIYGLLWSRPVTARRAVVPEILEPVWKKREYASPCFHPATGLVFVGASDRFLRAFDLQGHLVWRYEAGDSISSVPTFGSEHLFFGADDGLLYALDPASGELAWTHEADAEITGPIAQHSGWLFFTTALDTLYSIDAGTGEYRWHVKHTQPLGITLAGNSAPRVGSVWIGGERLDLVVSGHADGMIGVHEASSGKLRWSEKIGQGEVFFDVDADPVIIGPLLIAAANDGGVFGFDLATGAEIWRQKLEGITRLASNGDMIVGAGAGQAVGLSTGGALLWTYKFGKGTASRPVFDHQRVLFNVDTGPLLVLESRTGERLQAFGSPLGMAGEPAVSRDLLFVLSNGGDLYALSSEFGGWAHIRPGLEPYLPIR